MSECKKTSKWIWTFCAKHQCLSKFILTILLSLTGACTLTFLGWLLNSRPLFSTVVNSINNEWYINTFFSHNNTVISEPGHPNDITIVTVSDSFSSRKDIASVIRSVAAQKPKIICVDFFFHDNNSYDKTQNDSLQSAIADIKDSVTLVFVGFKGNNDYFSHSYFTKALELQYGASDFGGFGEYVRYFDGVPRISLKLSALLGVDTSALPKRFITNYKKKNFDGINIYNHTRLDTIPKIVDHDDIVLIGQSNSPYDLHTAPFTIKGNHKISGIEIIAYELSSILSYSNNLKSFDTEYPYMFLSFGCNALLYLLLSSLYVALINLLLFLNVQIKKKKKIKAKISNLNLFISPILFLFIEGLLILMCFRITTYCFFIPNISLLVASLIFVDPAFKISGNIIKSNCHNQ